MVHNLPKKIMARYDCRWRAHERRMAMKSFTYIAGAAVTAMITMAAIPNDAAAAVIGTLGVASAGGTVTLQSQGGATLPNIVPAVRVKIYQDAIINVAGT